MLPISECKDRLIRRTLRRVYIFCHFCPCGKRVYPLGKRNSVSHTAGKRTVHAPCIMRISNFGMGVLHVKVKY